MRDGIPYILTNRVQHRTDRSGYAAVACGRCQNSRCLTLRYLISYFISTGPDTRKPRVPYAYLLVRVRGRTAAERVTRTSQSCAIALWLVTRF